MIRRQHLARSLHRLGARVLFEFIDELARHHPNLGEDIDDRLAAYTERLSHNLLVATGGDRFPHSPMRVVGAGR